MALQTFVAEDRAVTRSRLQAPLLRWREALAGLPGIGAEIDADPTGNPFDRLRVTVGPEAACAAVDIVHALETGIPSIRVRTHQIEHGSFVMDPRSLGDGEQEVVADRLREAVAEARRNKREGGQDKVQEWKMRRARALSLWPDAPAEAAH